MTGESGANRTFRSLFGGQEKSFDEVLDLETDVIGSIEADSSVSGAAIVVAVNENKDEEEDGDDAMVWKEELLDCGVAAKGNSLQLAQHRSMEEWADEDDEEDNWKDMLQDRVDQLDLAFLPDDDGDDDASVFETKCRLEQQSVCKLSAHEIHAWNIERAVVGEAAASTLVHDARMRSTSIDCVARKIQTVEYYRKRSRSLSDTTDMLESPYYSLSRKNSLGSDRSCLSRDMSRDLRGIGEPLPTDATLSISSSTAVSVLSDTEAIRRFVLDDVKSMSVERLVSDAQRLHFLEDFYQNQRRQDAASPVVLPTAASSPPSVPSSPAMSTP
uniref:Uncharacterized protein n=1 Tax=Hyaloperonospora arabidopsidis (strain Emoy2) TaxID=559515 RepID=M4B5M9_HYAAE